MSHEAQDREDHKPSQDGSGTVENGDEEGSPEAGITELVIRTKSCENTPARPQRVEYLSCSCCPYLMKERVIRHLKLVDWIDLYSRLVESLVIHSVL